MRVAGRPSWRFAFGNGQASDLHAALYARDAAGLDVPAAPDVPPRLAADWLAGDASPRPTAVTAAGRASAAGQWLPWWRALLAVKVSIVDSRPPANGDMAATLAWAKLLHSSAVFDPPEFAALAATRELRAVITATYAAWPQVPDRSGSFDYGLIRSTAEQIAAEFGVPIEAMDARAHVLDVRGSWWHVVGPGCVLCSPGATSDPAVAAQLLGAVFASRLR